MPTIKIASTVANSVHEATLKLAPARMLTFLQAVGSSADIVTLLTTLGWSDERQKEAWSLLGDLFAVQKRRGAVGTRATPAAFAATTACEVFLATGMVCARAMLAMTHPEQATFLFEGLTASKGVVAVLDAGRFLDRCEALQKGAARGASHKADLEALATMATTGTTKETLRALRDQVAVAKSFVASPLTKDEVALERAATAHQREALRKIYAWITTWSEMARTVIKRRDLQIRLGIARPRRTKPRPQPAPEAVAAKEVTTSAAARSEEDEAHGPASRAA
jgi:hypothetical protein